MSHTGGTVSFVPPLLSQHEDRSAMKSLVSRSLALCLLGLVAVAVVAVAGCDKSVKKATIHGTVTYKGQPLRSGFLKFVGPDGTPAGAPIKSDGTFIVTDVVPGEVKVGVVATPQGSGGPGASQEPKSAPVDLPVKYQDPETSGLKYTITSDTKELAIEIKE
jgi:hypothetical protein